MAFFYFKKKLSLTDDNKREHDFHFCFIYNLLVFIILIEGYEENTASHRYVAGKGGFIKPSESLLGTLRPHLETSDLYVEFGHRQLAWLNDLGLGPHMETDTEG